MKSSARPRRRRSAAVPAPPIAEHSVSGLAQPTPYRFDDLPKDVQTLAFWILDIFQKDGSWPTQPEVIVRCYDIQLNQKIFQNRIEVFQIEHRGSLPAAVALTPWVLHDTGRVTSAFALAYQLFRTALSEVRVA